MGNGLAVTALLRVGQFSEECDQAFKITQQHLNIPYEVVVERERRSPSLQIFGLATHRVLSGFGSIKLFIESHPEFTKPVH